MSVAKLSDTSPCWTSWCWNCSQCKQAPHGPGQACPPDLCLPGATQQRPELGHDSKDPKPPLPLSPCTSTRQHLSLSSRLSYCSPGLPPFATQLLQPHLCATAGISWKMNEPVDGPPGLLDADQPRARSDRLLLLSMPTVCLGFLSTGRHARNSQTRLHYVNEG